AKFRHD
nr:Chain Q, GripI peptide fragment [synthetic construct]